MRSNQPFNSFLKRITDRTITEMGKSIYIFSREINERYLHHYFSHEWLNIYKTEMGEPLCLIDQTKNLILHPEWPTYKESTKVQYGRYKMIEIDGNNKYMPHKEGSAGIIDFAIGSYEKPEIGIELSLKYDWNHEEVVYQFIKLLDNKNPFKLVYLIDIFIRNEINISGTSLEGPHEQINKAYQEAKSRLGRDFDERRQAKFIFLEVSNKEMRKWVLKNGQFQLEDNAVLTTKRDKGLFGTIEHSEWFWSKSLFERNKSDFLEEAGVDLKTLKKWHSLNLLSFNPDEIEKFTEKEVEETRFLKTLMKSGLAFEKIVQMLEKLEKPYCYNFRQVYWDLEKEQWVSIEALKKFAVEDYIEENIEEIANEYISNLIEGKEEEGDFEEARIFDLGDYLLIKK